MLLKAYKMWRASRKNRIEGHFSWCDRRKLSLHAIPLQFILGLALVHII